MAAPQWWSQGATGGQGTLAVPPVLTLGEAHDILQWEGPISAKRAHRYLNEQRLRMCPQRYGGHPEVWAEEMTWCYDFNWRQYVAGHPRCRDIIGDGIASFWGVFLRTPDPNLSNERFDWVARRSFVDEENGVDAVRMHPGTGGHGVIVFGRLANWVTSETLARYFPDLVATRAATPEPSRNFQGYWHAHWIDGFSGAPARHFLFEAYDRWMDRPHPRGKFSFDITASNDFRWDMPLRSIPELANLVDHIAEIWVIWHEVEEQPAFALRLFDGKIFTVCFLRSGPPRPSLGRFNAEWDTSIFR